MSDDFNSTTNTTTVSVAYNASDWNVNVGTASWSCATTVPTYGAPVIDLEADAGKGLGFPDYKLPTMWEDILPSMHTVKEMCELYPSFKTAYEKFKTLYNICVDDYESRNRNS